MSKTHTTPRQGDIFAQISPMKVAITAPKEKNKKSVPPIAQEIMKALEPATNYYGALDHETKLSVCEYAIEPSSDKWNKISSMIISMVSPTKSNCTYTLWQAIRKVDPTFPAVGRSYQMDDHSKKSIMIKDWEQIPTPELILQALKYIA